MSKSQRKRPQSPKPLTAGRNEAWAEAKMNQARSNAAQPHKSKKAYSRNVKHVNREW